MQISYQWLKTWIPVDWSLATLSERLTAAGLELESVQPVGEDFYLDFKITPNRGDCLSILGLAREIALLSETVIASPKGSSVIASPKGVAIQTPVIASPKGSSVIASPKGVAIQTPVIASPKGVAIVYRGRRIEHIHSQAVTPDWMIQRLLGSRMKLIHPVVDILNYVMLELGQPMHAFDLDQITGTLQVRGSKPGESLVLLDHQKIELQENSVCVADETGVLALAGVMGGLESSITASTTSIFLESAWFEPRVIARQARLYGLFSDSAYRYERGVDAGGVERALSRATELIIEICGGQAGPVCGAGVLDLQRPMIVLRSARVLGLLGMVVPDETVSRILERVGCQVTVMENGWEVIPPTHRLDLILEVDLIEEVGRVVGYDQLPNAPLKIWLNPQKVSESTISGARLLSAAVDRGYNEVITYSFVSEALQAWADPQVLPKMLINPITQEMSCMRTQVWPSLVETWAYNRAHQQDRLKIVEFGHRYAQNGSQTAVIAGLWAGQYASPGWSDQARVVDFFDVKGDLEGLLSLWGVKRAFSPAEHPALHPGQTATISVNGQDIGFVGALHPKIQVALGLTEPVFVFEMAYERLHATKTQVTPLSKFPSIRRDIALLLPSACLVSSLINTLQETIGSLLVDCFVFDVYQGKGIPVGQKSVALGLLLQHSDRTFKDEEIEVCMVRVKQAVKAAHAAILRE